MVADAAHVPAMRFRTVEIGFAMPTPRRAMLVASFLLPLLASAASCADRTIATVPIDNTAEARVTFDVSENRDVDLLFVIDNSRSMELEQQLLTEKFGNVISALSDHPDGLPSIHVAVISTDLGSGEGPDQACSPNGDNGRFQGQSCGSLDGSFLKSIAMESGGRSENFQGELTDTFTCMATLGKDGCGFEQPLESMRRALTGPEAGSFLREHAYLAVVIVSDEDDCSAHNPAIFDKARVDLDSPLGPAKSFRCFEFGVQCEQDEDQVRSLGARSGCVPRDNSDYLYDVDEYVQFLYSLKPSPDQILVATIAGELTPLEVVTKHDDRQDLDYIALAFSCTKPDAEAVPPIRLSAFVDGFAEDNGQKTSICADDLGGALDDIARLITEKAAACLQGGIADTNSAQPGIQPDCVVGLTEPGQAERTLGECDNTAQPQASSIVPCYLVTENANCLATETHLAVKVHYAEGFTVPIGTSASAHCLGE